MHHLIFLCLKVSTSAKHPALCQRVGNQSHSNGAQSWWGRDLQRQNLDRLEMGLGVGVTVDLDEIRKG